MGSEMCIRDSSSSISLVHFSEPCIDLQHLRSETLSDRFLQDLKQRIVDGHWSNVTKYEKSFKNMALQLSVDENDCIRLGSRIVPPRTLYRRIFEKAHESHCGMQATLKLIQREFFWPRMRQQIDAMVNNCDVCRGARFRSKDTTHKWPIDDEPWSRVHICLLYTSPSPRDLSTSRMPSSA